MIAVHFRTVLKEHEFTKILDFLDLKLLQTL